MTFDIEDSMKRKFHKLPLLLSCAAILITAPVASFGQNTNSDLPPVIDVHVHAMDDAGPLAVPMCPNTEKFTASDPSTKEAPFGWAQEECTPKLYPAAKGEYMKDVVAEMDRLNVTAVVFGDPGSVAKWKNAAPNRVIPGTGFETGMGGGRVSVDELRKDFREDGFKVMGEIGLQYEGLSPSDPSVDQYFALAEQLDIPVAIIWAPVAPDAPISPCPSFAGPKAIRCFSKICWRGTPNCVCKSCTRATQ